MLSPSSYEFCSEIYVVEKAVEVVAQIAGEVQTIRIEVLQDLRDGHYCTRAYSNEHVTLQPSYPQTGESHDRPPEAFQVWVDYDLPWTHCESADQALSQALSFLGERKR